MSDLALRGAIAAVRAWTTIYTSGLPSEQRDARREEIDSDLWESVNDTASARRTLALQIVARLDRRHPGRSRLAPRACRRCCRVAMASRADRGGCRGPGVVARARADVVGTIAGIAGIAASLAARGEADRRAAAATSTAAAVCPERVSAAPGCVHQVAGSDRGPTPHSTERRTRWRKASESRWAS